MKILAVTLYLLSFITGLKGKWLKSTMFMVGAMLILPVPL